MPEISGEKSYLRTNEAAEELGVSRPTLLRWFRERRVADVAMRDRKGWRLFAPADIKRLKNWIANGE